jgi:hypothetical protein
MQDVYNILYMPLNSKNMGCPMYMLLKFDADCVHPNDIDAVVSAEIPSDAEDKELVCSFFFFFFFEIIYIAVVGSAQFCIKHNTELQLSYYCMTDFIMPFRVLHFFEVLSLSKVLVEAAVKWGLLEWNAPSYMSMVWHASASSQALVDTAQVLFFVAAPQLVEAVGTVGVGGGGGLLEPDMFGSVQVTVLPLFAATPTPLLAPLARGHQCRFMVLQDANLCPHHVHFHCGSSLAASTLALASFCWSRLNVWFLFHASCFFSF